jgi:hypothetical protein
MQFHVLDLRLVAIGIEYTNVMMSKLSLGIFSKRKNKENDYIIFFSFADVKPNMKSHKGRYDEGQIV